MNWPVIAFLRQVATLLTVAATVRAAQLDSLPNPAPAKGPLRVRPENPCYFTDGTKGPNGSLKAIYLTGSHHWSNLQDSARLGDPLTESLITAATWLSW